MLTYLKYFPISFPLFLSWWTLLILQKTVITYSLVWHANTDTILILGFLTWLLTRCFYPPKCDIWYDCYCISMKLCFPGFRIMYFLKFSCIFQKTVTTCTIFDWLPSFASFFWDGEFLQSHTLSDVVWLLTQKILHIIAADMIAHDWLTPYL